MSKSHQAEHITQKPMHLQDWLLLLTLSFAWGISFFFIQIALKGFAPLTIVFWRVFSGAITLNLVLLFRKEKLPRDRKSWGQFFIISIFNNVLPFTLIVWAGTQISSGLSSILNASAPLWAVLIAHFYNHEKITTGKFIGMVLGFGGVTIMIGVNSLAGIGMNTLGQLAMLLATLCYAFAGAYSQRVKQHSPAVLATGQVTVSTGILFILMMLIDHPWLQPAASLTAWAAVIELGVVGTAIAYLLYFQVLRSSGASNALLVTFLIPVTALIFGIAFLNETLQVYHFFGMALIAGGLLSIDGRLLKRFRKAPEPSSIAE